MDDDKLAPNGAAASNYVMSEMIVLSPNAVSFLESVIKDYDPEPWESSMKDHLLESLKVMKHPI